MKGGWLYWMGPVRLTNWPKGSKVTSRRLLQGNLPLFHILPNGGAADSKSAGYLRFVPITNFQQFGQLFF